MLLLALASTASATRLAAAAIFCAVSHYPNPPVSLWCDGSATVSQVTFADWGLSTPAACGHYAPNASCTSAAVVAQLEVQGWTKPVKDMMVTEELATLDLRAYEQASYLAATFQGKLSWDEKGMLGRASDSWESLPWPMSKAAGGPTVSPAGVLLFTRCCSSECGTGV